MTAKRNSGIRQGFFPILLENLLDHDSTKFHENKTKSVNVILLTRRSALKMVPPPAYVMTPNLKIAVKYKAPHLVFVAASTNSKVGL